MVIYFECFCKDVWDNINIQISGLQGNKLPSRMWVSFNQSAEGMSRPIDGAPPSGRDSAGRQPSDWKGGMSSSGSPASQHTVQTLESLQLVGFLSRTQTGKMSIYRLCLQARRIHIPLTLSIPAKL